MTDKKPKRAPLSDAERQAARFARLKEAGLVRVEVHVHADDREAVKLYAEKLNKKRQTQGDAT